MTTTDVLTDECIALKAKYPGFPDACLPILTAMDAKGILPMFFTDRGHVLAEPFPGHDVCLYYLDSHGLTNHRAQNHWG